MRLNFKLACAPLLNRLDWRWLTAIGALSGLVLGLALLLSVPSPWWLAPGALLFVALVRLGWDAEPQLAAPLVERRPPRPARPRPVRDGPFEMVELPGGAFLMGSPDDDTMANDDERPQHQVQVSGFRIARTPVTRAVYEPVMAREVKGKDAAGGDLPATRVTWEDAIAFCNRLSLAHGYRRPRRHPGLPRGRLSLAHGYRPCYSFRIHYPNRTMTCKS